MQVSPTGNLGKEINTMDVIHQRIEEIYIYENEREMGNRFRSAYTFFCYSNTEEYEERKERRELPRTEESQGTHVVKATKSRRGLPN